jgi:hypothetical protein
MLIAAIIAALAAALAGSAIKPDLFDKLLRYWRRALRRHVDDPDRRAAGELVLDDFELEAAALVNDLREWMQAFAQVHRRYESRLADYDRLADFLVADIFVAQMRFVDLTDELRRAIGDAAYFEITDDVERQLRKARAKRERREAKQQAKSTNR